MAKRVSSYDLKAPIPAVGSRWVWEIDKPWARELIEVVEVKWNGEEWWIATESLINNLTFLSGAGPHWNDLSRFHEAVVPVGTYGRWVRWSPSRGTHYTQ